MNLPSFSLVPHKVSTRFTDPLVAPLAGIGVTPNMISAAGFAGNVAAGALAAGGHFVWAGAVMLFFSGLDLLDGALARKTNTVTKFGALFDSVLDRLSEAAVLGGLLYHFDAIGGHTEEILVIYAAVVGSILVSYVRARAQGDGMDLREGVFTRAERVLLVAGALVVAGLTTDEVLRWALSALAVMAHLTVAQRVWAVRQKLAAQGER